MSAAVSFLLHHIVRLRFDRFSGECTVGQREGFCPFFGRNECKLLNKSRAWVLFTPDFAESTGDGAG